MIKFRCGHCGQKLGVPDEFSGRRVRCTNCDEPSMVPASGGLEDSAVAMELDPLEADDAGGGLRLREEESPPTVWSSLDMGLSADGEEAERAKTISRARRRGGAAKGSIGRVTGDEDEVDEGAGGRKL